MIEEVDDILQLNTFFSMNLQRHCSMQKVSGWPSGHILTPQFVTIFSLNGSNLIPVIFFSISVAFSFE